MTTSRRLDARWLGRQRYEPVLAQQRRLLQKQQASTIDDVVLFVEHESVITMGRGSTSQNLLASRDLLGQVGLDLAGAERGGDIT